MLAMVINLEAKYPKLLEQVTAGFDFVEQSREQFS